uniref:Uncharacterized protein n=1 Tax=Theropithecus gelada TaxID=9565 RepID=A0A8D2F8N6_THEGE
MAGHIISSLKPIRVSITCRIKPLASPSPYVPFLRPIRLAPTSEPSLCSRVSYLLLGFPWPIKLKQVSIHYNRKQYHAPSNFSPSETLPHSLLYMEPGHLTELI